MKHLKFNTESKAQKGSEEALQEACANYLGFVHPKVKFFHPPNGGKREAITGAKLKRHGVKRGVPDLLITGMKLAIELKTGANKPTEEQIEWLEHFREIGWNAFWVNSFDEFRECLKWAEKQMKP